ncbi:MAG TPA: methyl-accepting chemotaxis protein, partial [Desulfobacteria bacterium]|nr:methyl-accepting chemotaxis protein [Desulfobacteria bacterium]
MMKLWNKLTINQKAFAIIVLLIISPTVIMAAWLNYNLDSAYSRGLNLAILTTVVSFMSLAAGFLISRSVTLPLSKLVNTMNEVAKGNLTARAWINTQDELGTAAQAFNIAILRLQVLSALVRQAALRVASTSDKLSTLAEQGASSTNMVVRSMEDLAKGNLENAQLLDNNMEIVNQLIDAIESVAAGAQEQARDISQTTTNTSGMAKKIAEVSERTEGLKLAAQQN